MKQNGHLGRVLKRMILALFPVLIAEGFLTSELCYAGAKTESVFDLKSTWVRQDGVSRHLNELVGGPVIVAMVYTSCEHACPLLIEDVKKIVAGLVEQKNSANYQVALFSFDTLRDTPAALQAYALKKKLDSKHWSFYHGDAKAVRELAAAMNIRFTKDNNGDYDHSNVITLLDKAGVVRYQQQGLNQNPREFIRQWNAL